jgi:hypothetical protein
MLAKTPITRKPMGQQLKRVTKRRRRTAYLERKKEAAKLAATSIKAKK